jgi:tetratricopeptide (TPR) repeat protein
MLYLDRDEKQIMQNQAKYKAFLSYSHADAKQARSLHHFIETFKVPKRLVGRETKRGPIPRRLRPVFKDREELPSSSDLNSVINDALKSSEFLIVICSPDSAQSRWVNEEVISFKQMGRGDRILCIIIDGEPNATDIPGREAEECFCEALRFRLGDDGQFSRERAAPVAADARLGQDGRYPARLKLVAGMLGLGLDDLRQRDMRRRHRRMVVVTSASVAGMALTLMLALAAYIARDDAERHREQADDLIGFMLGDLHDRLNEVGRLDVLDSVSIKAMEYFANMAPKDLDEDALLSRAQTLSQLGQAHLTRGQLDEAMSPFEEALHVVEELSARGPDNLARLFELGQAHFWVGYVYWERNDLIAADESWQHYYQISEVLYKADPENDDYVLELAFAFNNLAILSDRRGDIELALDYNRRMIDLSLEVYERDKENETYLQALADAYSWSGSILRRDSQLTASVDRFAQYLELVEEAGRRDLANTRWIENRMLAHRFLAQGMLELGNVETARSNFEAGMLLAQQLIEIEAANKLWQIEHAMMTRRLVQMDIRAGKIEHALQNLESTRTSVQERLTDNPDDDWLQVKVELDLTAAKLLLEQGDNVAAALIADAVVGVARRLYEKDPSKLSPRTALINSLILKARIATVDAGSSQDHTVWQEVLTVIDEAEKDHIFPEAPDAYIRASLYSDHRNNIDNKIKLLHDSGYQHPDFVMVLQEYGIDY